MVDLIYLFTPDPRFGKQLQTEEKMRININYIEGSGFEAEVICGGNRSICKEDTLQSLFSSILPVADSMQDCHRRYNEALQVIIQRGQHLTEQELQNIIKTYRL